MNITIMYSSATTESPLSAYFVAAKYMGQFDSNGTANDVTLHNVKGVTHLGVDAVIYTIAAGSQHRVFNFAPLGTGTGQVSTSQIADLVDKLIGSPTDPLSDDKVISILPATFPTTFIDGKNQAQNTWNALFSFIGMPTFKGSPSAFAAGYITDSGLTITVDAYIGYTLQIISGTGAGQIRTITSNTAGGRFNVGVNFTVTPDATSVYQITEHAPKEYPLVLGYFGGDGYPLPIFGTTVYDTATSGSTTTIVNSGNPYTIDALSGLYGLIYDGAGKGQKFKVVTATTTPGTANTVSTINLSTTLTTAAASGSKFYLCSREDQVYALEAFQKYIWTYCITLDQFANAQLHKMFNANLGLGLSIARQEIVEPAPQDFTFIHEVVEVLGKAMFDYAATGGSPIAP